jgi:hypothetical protein
VPIPGTGRLERIEENLRAADIQLTAEDLAELDRVSPKNQVRETTTPSRCSASSAADRPAAHSARWRPTGRPPLGVDSFAYGVGTMLILPVRTRPHRDKESTEAGAGPCSVWSAEQYRAQSRSCPRVTFVHSANTVPVDRVLSAGRRTSIREVGPTRGLHHSTLGAATATISHLRVLVEARMQPVALGDQLELGVQLPAIR